MATIQERLTNWLEPEESQPETEDSVKGEDLTEEPESSSQPDDFDETETAETNDSENMEPEVSAESDIENLEDLAQALGKPLDDVLATLKGRVKIDGEESEVSLAELRNGYQRDADYRNKTKALAVEREKFEKQQQEQRTQFAEKLTQADAVINELENNLLSEFNGINWKDLEENDREEYLIQRQKFTDRYQSIQSAKTKLEADAKKLVQENQEKFEKQKAEFVDKEANLLKKAIPEWGDPKVAQQEMGELMDYLQSIGFQPNEANELIDHRAWIIARKAYLYDKGQKSIDIAKKKVKKLPKIQKPGKPSVDTKNRQYTKEREQLKKTGNVKDAAKLFERFV